MLLNALVLPLKSRNMLVRIPRFIFVAQRLTSATCQRVLITFIEVKLVLNVVFLLLMLWFWITTN